MSRIATLIILSLLTACAGFGGKQSQEVSAGDNSVIEQEADQNSGSNKVEADLVETVTTINEGNIDIQMMLTILGSVAVFSLLIGLIIPQPRFIRWFF